MKTHAQTNLLASLLQQSQRHMPGEMYCYPLTPTQTPRCSHCHTPSPETSRDLSLLLPQKATTLRQKYTEKLLCKYTLEDLSWKSVSVHVQARALCRGGEESTSGCWSLIFSRMLIHRMDELSAPPLPFATLSLSLCPKPNEHTWKMAYDSLKISPVHLYCLKLLIGTKRKHQFKHKDHSSPQRLTVLSAVIQNVVRENF